MTVEITPAESPEDVARAVEIHNSVFPRRRIDLADVLDYYEHAVDHAVLLARLDGELAGVAELVVEPDVRHPVGGAKVPEPHRRRGVGSALLAAASAWARERGHDRLGTSIEADDEASIAWARKRGFEERTRDSRMVLDLEETPAPLPEPPEGIRIVTWAERPDLSVGVYEVYREASPDVPGEEDEPVAGYEEWLRLHMGGRGDRPEATFVALAGEEVVGYAKFSLTDAQPDRAFHDLTGVKRAWRGRGIARALKATQIAWAEDMGYRYVETMNEERNEPIRRLNVAFGYREQPGRVIMVGPVA